MQSRPLLIPQSSQHQSIFKPEHYDEQVDLLLSVFLTIEVSHPVPSRSHPIPSHPCTHLRNFLGKLFRPGALFRVTYFQHTCGLLALRVKVKVS